MILQIGDRVRVTSKNSNFFGCDGEVIQIPFDKWVDVKLDKVPNPRREIGDGLWMFHVDRLDLI